VESRSLMTSEETRDLSGKTDRPRLLSKPKMVKSAVGEEPGAVQANGLRMSGRRGGSLDQHLVQRAERRRVTRIDTPVQDGQESARAVGEESGAAQAAGRRISGLRGEGLALERGCSLRGVTGKTRWRSPWRVTSPTTKSVLGLHFRCRGLLPAPVSVTPRHVPLDHNK